MVCPCVLPLLATTSAGGAIVSRKNKWLMWGFFIFAVLLLFWYIMYLYKKRSNCSVCKKR